jgi:predicted thioesterase
VTAPRGGAQSGGAQSGGGAPQAGARATLRITVTEADTAIEVGSGDVPVLATPRLLALAEAACVAAVSPRLAAGQTSVGTAVQLEHRQASPVGAELDVEAELTEVRGSRLTFVFIVRPVEDEDAVVGAGTIERVIVDRARFTAQTQH